MKFIKNDGTDIGQVRLILQHACQDAFSHNLNSRLFANLRGAANAVAHGFPNRFANCLRHALSGGARCKAAWFEHKYAASG